jgi:hypothetical protein
MGIRKTLLIATTALVVPLAVQAAPLGSMAAQSHVASTLNNSADMSVLYHDANWFNEGNDDVKDWWNGGEEGGDNERGDNERGDWNEDGERGNWWNESGESGRHNWWNESGEAGERGNKNKNKWSKKWNENGEGGERWDDDDNERGGRGYSWSESGEEGGERW